MGLVYPLVCPRKKKTLHGIMEGMLVTMLATIDWKTVPGVKVPPDRELIWKDLWTAHMAFVMMKYFFKPEDSASKFLPSS